MPSQTNSSPQPALEIQHLVKRFGSITAIDDISLAIKKGEIFGLIGPDGAGKTTLFRLMTTLLTPDKGTCLLEGLDTVKDYYKIRHRIGYMPGRFSLYGDLTVEENLNFFASLFNVTPEQNRHLINDIYCQIEPFKTRYARQLSGGMKQKLALCCALIHAPSVLFLDEPTTGIDPVSRKELWQMLQRLKSQGITIVASTPYMDEARQCQRIAFIQKGKILTLQSPTEIVKSYSDTLFSVSAQQMHALLTEVRNFNGVKCCYSFGDSHHFTVDSDFSMNDFKNYLSRKDFQQIEIQQIEPSIEDCYINLSQQ